MKTPKKAKSKAPKGNDGSKRTKTNSPIADENDTDRETSEWLKFSEAPQPLTDRMMDEQGRLHRSALEMVIKFGDPKYMDWAKSQSSHDLFQYACAILNTLYSPAIKEDVNDASPRSSPPGTKSSGTDILGAIADLNCKLLRSLTLNGNHGALSTYFRLICEIVEDLNRDALAFAHIFHPASLNNAKWPVIYSPNSSLSSNLKELQDLLKIGESHFVKLKPQSKGRPWNIETPVNKIAYRGIMECWLLSLAVRVTDFRKWLLESGAIAGEKLPRWASKCEQLPIFSKSSLDAWINFWWEMILEKTNGGPEKYKLLGKIGKKKEHDSVQHRAQIKLELKAAFRRLANDIPGFFDFERTKNDLKACRDYLARHPKLHFVQWNIQVNRILRKVSESNRTVMLAALTQALNQDTPLDSLYAAVMNALKPKPNESTPIKLPQKQSKSESLPR